MSPPAGVMTTSERSAFCISNSSTALSTASSTCVSELTVPLRTHQCVGWHLGSATALLDPRMPQMGGLADQDDAVKRCELIGTLTMRSDALQVFRTSSPSAS